MKILYIHQYFKTPLEAGGTRSYWIAKELIRYGHDVVMLTSTNESGVSIQKKVIEDIQVIYLKQLYHQNMTVKQRLKAFNGFVWKSIKEGRKQESVDLVIATSTPLTVGITALYLKWFHKIPFIFEVRDLWPEVPIQLGAFKSKFIKKLTRWLEKKIYQNAQHIIALSPGMQAGVLKYVPREKTTMIPNMSKIDKFWPRDKNQNLMKSIGLSKDTFKIIHFGSLGLANGIDSVLDSAKLLKDDKTVQFVFLGSGAAEKDLKAYCEQERLQNVVFISKAPMDKTSEIVNFCDASLVSFKDIPILYTNSPNKLFDSLSAGKPIIVNSAGWTKEMVQKHNCGLYANPIDPKNLVDSIKFLQSNPDIVKQMGQNSRKLAETKYDKSLLCKQFVSVIEQKNQ
jgi:glycosyltransferase involved in cell wall biosynthesis